MMAMLSAAPALRADMGRLLEATKMGVVGDGATVNTIAIQKAIDACSAGGGGAIQFPAGHYVTGTIQLKDNVTLRLDENAVLQGSTNAADYRNVDPFVAGDGVALGYALMVAQGAHDVGIEGAGTIDGRGAELKAAQSHYTVRPFLMRWLRCTHVAIREVRLTNPAAWTLNFFQTRDATVERVTIRTRHTGLINNDGIDLDSCERVTIRGCDIDSGDDALCFKATSPLPCRDILASDCKLSTKCNAIKLGTESLGDFEKITVANCQLHDVGLSGIALNSVDGAHLHDVTVRDITMDGVGVPVFMRLGARLRTFRPGDRPKTPGILRDVTIKNVTARGVRHIGVLISGIPGHPVEMITLENVRAELPGGGKRADGQVQLPENESAYPEYNMFGRVLPAYGIYARHVRGVTFKNVQMAIAQPDARRRAMFVDVEGGRDFFEPPVKQGMSTSF
jgi:polygalacturonase